MNREGLLELYSFRMELCLVKFLHTFLTSSEFFEFGKNAKKIIQDQWCKCLLEWSAIRFSPWMISWTTDLMLSVIINCKGLQVGECVKDKLSTSVNNYVMEQNLTSSCPDYVMIPPPLWIAHSTVRGVGINNTNFSSLGSDLQTGCRAMGINTASNHLLVLVLACLLSSSLVARSGWHLCQEMRPFISLLYYLYDSFTISYYGMLIIL